MAQVVRQSELFAGEDWKVIYRAFTDINFNAYDFDTIRQSMVDYIRTNFPEDFNDWIESSEFIFILDLLAYLGEQLAFRFDLNVRENFIDTAERKDSILRLARMLSYSPRRNFPASGLLKIEQITTTESLRDSNERDLSNRTITWNDPANPDWFEQFILVINSAVSTINPFGRPVKAGTVVGNRTQLYTLNNLPLNKPAIPFGATVDGIGMNFEIVNVDFTDNEFFFEKTPDPADPLSFLFINDGLGNNSANTGFFFFFKQGNLQFEDFLFRDPIENRLVNINTQDINENDFWLQEITENGQIIKDWRQVPTVFGENIVFNSVNREERDIFTVLTRDDSEVSLRFADGRFGDVPRGFFRTWFRTSNGLVYRIRPQDIERQSVSIQYLNSTDETHTVTFTFSLKENVTNSRPAETAEQVRQRAPRVYFTQNRMVTGEDYNSFPQRSNLARRIKAVNRVYSGHSRFIDINDPTGTFQDTNVFSDDGIIYKTFENNFKSIPKSLNKSSSELVLQDVQPLLQDIEMKNFLFDQMREQFKLTEEGTATGKANIPGTANPVTWIPIIWIASTSVEFNNTGIFTQNVAQGNGGDSSDYVTESSSIKFQSAGWVKVVSIVDFGNEFPNNDTSLKGEVTLSKPVENNDEIIEIRPAFRTTLTQNEFDAIREEFDKNNSFAIRYDLAARVWKVVAGNNIDLNSPFNLATAGKLDPNNSDASWLVFIEFNPDLWKMTARGLMYIFESELDVRFFFIDRFKINDLATGRTKRDTIRVFKINYQPHTNPEEWIPTNEYEKGNFVTFEEKIFRATVDLTTPVPPAPGFLTSEWIEVEVSALVQEHIWKLDRPFIFEDGHVDPRRVRIDFFDEQDDGVEDNPESFEEIVLNDFFDEGDIVEEKDRFIFWETFIDEEGFINQQPKTDITVISEFNPTPILINSDNLSLTFGERILPSVNEDDNGDELPQNADDVVFALKVVPEPYSEVSLNPHTAEPVHYLENDFVLFEEKIFKAKGSTTIGPFLPEEWTLVSDYPLKWQFFQFSIASNKWEIKQNNEFSFFVGRNDISFQWKHFAPRNHRIDPTITNIIDIFVLTTEFDTATRLWISSGADLADRPAPPTNNDLNAAFAEFEEFKMVSDQLIWKPVNFKVLFGNGAEEELQAKFKVVKINGSAISDGEVRSRVVAAINEFFEIDNWDFGETFFYTELAAFIHQQLATEISSVVIVPNNEEAKFGNLFQVKAEPDEIMISSATVADVIIVESLTETNLRIGN